MSDTKKSQTIRNLWYKRVALKITEANIVVVAIRAAIVANNLAGEFTAGELSAIQDVEIALGSLASLPGVTSSENKYVSSHRSKAIIIEGVNN